MSKSITGSGSLNLTLNELRLLEIKAISLESTNAVISNTLSGNNAVFSGTINTVGISVSGTFTVSNISVSGTINANNIICTGEITYKNQTLDNRFVTNTTLTTILNDYVLTTDLNNTLNDYVLTTDLNNTLNDYVLTTDLNNTLNNYVDISSTQTITGDKTFSGSFKLNLQPTTTISSYLVYPLGYYPTNSTTGSINRFDSFSYNGYTQLLKAPNLEISGDANIDNDLTVDNDLQVNNNVEVTNNLTVSGKIQNNPIQTSAALLDYPLLFVATNDSNTYKVDTELGSLTYNPNANMLFSRNISFDQYMTGTSINLTGDITCNDLTTSGNFSIGNINAITSSGQFDIPILAYNSNTGIHTFRKATHGFYHTPNNNTLYVRNIITNQDGANTGTIITDRLDVEDLYIDTTDNTSFGFLRIPFITGSNQLRVNSSNFLVQPSTGIVKQGIEIKTSGEFQVLFYDSTNKTLCSDSQPSQFIYNASNNKLSLGNIVINNETQITKITGTSNLDFEIPFINSSNQIRVNSNLKFNPQEGNVTTNSLTLLTIDTPTNSQDLNLQVGGTDKIVIEDTKTCIKNTACLESVTVPTTSTQFPVLLLNEGTNEVKKSDDFLEYDPVLNRIYAKDIMINDAGTSGRLTLVETIRYGGSLFYTPLNYTYIIGNTDNIETIDSTNNGKFGNGTYIGITTTVVKLTAFGANSDLWTFNASDNSTNTSTSFTCKSIITGAWEVTITCDYTTSSSSGSNRVNPILRFVKNGTEIEEGARSIYIRNQFGRVGTMESKYIFRLATDDTIQLRTYVNYGTVTDYSSTMSATDFTLTNFNFMATFLGPLQEYDRTPSVTPPTDPPTE